MSRAEARLQVDAARRARRPAETLAVSPERAAAMLGIARSTFYASVLGELRVVRLGRRRLIPIAELERWLEQNAERPGRIR